MEKLVQLHAPFSGYIKIAREIILGVSKRYTMVLAYLILHEIQFKISIQTVIETLVQMWHDVMMSFVNAVGLRLLGI